MDKVIVVKQIDGSIAIIHPAPEMFDDKSRTRNLLKQNGFEFESDEDIWDYIVEKNQLQKDSYYFAEISQLPSDRYFRNAWEHDEKNETVSINTLKAKEVKKNVFRELRKPLLEKLDVDFMRALEKNIDPSEINQKKQTLRDVTGIQLPNNLDDLKNFTPVCLQESS